jgi:hypothetical protein
MMATISVKAMDLYLRPWARDRRMLDPKRRKMKNIMVPRGIYEK